MMKKISFLFLTLMLTGFVFANQTITFGKVQFIDVTTMDELTKIISSHEGEYFFLFYHSQTCPACNYMKESVFADPNIAELMDQNIIPVAVDVYKGREIKSLRYIIKDKVLVIQPDNAGYYVPKSEKEEITVSVPGTPTMVVFKVEKGEKILKGVAIGALSPKSFESFIKEATKDKQTFQSEKQEKSKISFAVLLTIFSAGILSIFSPCVLPLIISGFTLILAKRNLELIISGIIVSFSLLGALAGSLGSFVAQIASLFYLIGGVGFIILGTLMISNRAETLLIEHLSLFQSSANRITKRQGKLADFLFGTALGVTWIGCIAPYVGFAILTAALSGDFIRGFVVMFVYSLGLGLTLYLILSSKELAEWINRKFLSNKLSLSVSKGRKWEKALGILLVLIGFLMLTELTPLKLWSKLFESLAL